MGGRDEDGYCGHPSTTQVIGGDDREGDVFDIVVHAVETDRDVLIRAAWDRRLVESAGAWWTTVAAGAHPLLPKRGAAAPDPVRPVSSASLPRADKGHRVFVQPMHSVMRQGISVTPNSRAKRGLSWTCSARSAPWLRRQVRQFSLNGGKGNNGQVRVSKDSAAGCSAEIYDAHYFICPCQHPWARCKPVDRMDVAIIRISS